MAAKKEGNPSKKIDDLIDGLTDWRGKTIANIRKIIHGADSKVIEEWKWMGTPTWSHDGIFAIANPHKGKVKLTFSQGAHLPDPTKFFNNGLSGKQRRAADFYEGDKVDPRALKALVRAAIAYNVSKLEKN
ncbi:MAG: DUF1801 domain-containing protein [Candidatus Eremiobacteraeota bacterium]|nr:DUF1801 domain-containing protein [Candidatus Eremiobacteraeota bacterium]